LPSWPFQYAPATLINLNAWMRLVEGMCGPRQKSMNFAGGIEGDEWLYGFFFDELALEDLNGFFVEIESFRFGNELAFVGKILAASFVHFRFNLGQVFGSKGLIAQEFVERSRCRWAGPMPSFTLGYSSITAAAKKMRGGMTEYEERIGIFFGEYLQLYVLVERTAQVRSARRRHHWERRHERRARHRQGEVKFSGDVRGRGALGHFLYLAVPAM